MKAVAVFIARVFSDEMVDGFMLISPFRQTVIDVVLVGEHEAPRLHRLRNDRFDRCLLNIGQHIENDIAVTLNQAEDRRFLRGERPTSRCST